MCVCVWYEWCVPAQRTSFASSGSAVRCMWESTVPSSPPFETGICCHRCCCRCCSCPAATSGSAAWSRCGRMTGPSSSSSTSPALRASRAFRPYAPKCGEEGKPPTSPSMTSSSPSVLLCPYRLLVSHVASAQQQSAAACACHQCMMSDAAINLDLGLRVCSCIDMA